MTHDLQKMIYTPSQETFSLQVITHTRAFLLDMDGYLQLFTRLPLCCGGDVASFKMDNLSKVVNNSLSHLLNSLWTTLSKFGTIKVF